MELGGRGYLCWLTLSSPRDDRDLETNYESPWKDLLPFSEEWLRVSRKPSPQLMVPLSFLINTWPWARLPSLLCHEGPVIYDLGVSHRPWQGANGSGPNVFFHSVANEGGACKFCRQNDCVGIFSDAPSGLAVNLFPGRCSRWSLADAGRVGGGPSRL